MQLTVLRGAGARLAPDVVEPLLASEAAGIERGRREINYHGSGRTLEQCQCPLHDFIETGSLVWITESEQQWSGLVRYFSLTVTVEVGGHFTADTALHVEREMSE